MKGALQLLIFFLQIKKSRHRIHNRCKETWLLYNRALTKLWVSDLSGTLYYFFRVLKSLSPVLFGIHADSMKIKTSYSNSFLHWRILQSSTQIFFKQHCEKVSKNPQAHAVCSTSAHRIQLSPSRLEEN